MDVCERFGHSINEITIRTLLLIKARWGFEILVVVESRIRFYVFSNKTTRISSSRNYGGCRNQVEF